MNLDQINKIIRLKHSIGAHTYSHIDLKNVKNNKKIKYEIVDSANELQKILKIKINDFSFNFGRLRDISSRMLSLSKKRFDFIYTGIRGDNSDIDKIIFRDNVLPSDNKYDLFTYLSGQLDFLYSNERKTLRSKFKKK